MAESNRTIIGIFAALVVIVVVAFAWWWTIRRSKTKCLVARPKA